MNKSGILNKENIKTVITLSLICVIVAALIGAVYLLAAPIIEKAEEQKRYDSLREVIDGTFTPMDKPDGASESIIGMYKVTDGETLVGYAVTLGVKGYASTIYMTVGVSADGSVTKAVVTSEAESHGKAGMKNYADRFAGVDAENLSEVDTFTGATISSTAIKNGVIIAVNAAIGGTISAPDNDGGTEEPPAIEMPKTDDEVLDLAGELVVGSSGFTDVTPTYGKPGTLLRLYKENEGLGYVAYIVTPGQYVPVANEILLHIDNNGDIVGIKHLAWVVGHGVTADGFADEFIGKDNWTVNGVDLVAGATGTSGDFRTAVADALDTVTKMIKRTDAKLLQLVDEMVPNSKSFELVDIPEGAPEELKRIYEETSGKGYVAYIVTAGEYIEISSESLVYFDTEGNILDMNILVWNVGHGIGYGDFNERFKGKNIKNINEVELVAGATGTSSDIHKAVAMSMPYIPTDFPIARVIGIAVLSLSFIASIALAVYFRRRENG